ncbi:MAG: helix-turn-helix domain-containing protein [Prevotellaceae bacterium]|nr:helix-turn-helix domain-containing protein [Prevotellaceae bacterium]
MLRFLLSFIPFYVCLFWFITFITHYRKSDTAKRILTWFLFTCVVLYFCHALYFTVGLPHTMECVWTLCSMSVYPLYYVYICNLVSRPNSPLKIFIILLPGIIVALAKYFFPGEDADNARKLLFAIQLFVVIYFGYRKLRAFDKELANVYADTEGRDTTAVKHLLVAFLITSMLSGIANLLGKQYFAESDWLVFAVLTPFSVMLFALSYIGFTRDFSYEQFVEDSKDYGEQPTENKSAEEERELGYNIEQLVITKQLYLTPNLKIGDVAKVTGICRTYISTYINQTKGVSFSDYINGLRVEHAKSLLSQNTDNTKIATLATRSGFSSEQSFYRNFHKFTGMKPLEWANKRTEE